MSFINQQIISGGRAVGGGGGGGAVPALPTLTTSGMTHRFRLYADAPTGHLYQDNALTSQAVAGNTVLGIKDLSVSANNFANTAGGFGSVLTANAVNAKRALAFFASSVLLENDTSGQVDLFRTATDVTLLCVFEMGSIPGAGTIMKMGLRSSSGSENCFVLRFGSAGTFLYGGRWGSDGGANFPLTTYPTTLEPSWSDWQNKFFKVVLRAKPGLGSVQKLDISVSDGSLVRSGSTTYTNLSGDVDGASTAWDFAGIGGYYFAGGRVPSINAYVCEASLWTGTSQTSDADTASLLSYAAGTAGF